MRDMESYRTPDLSEFKEGFEYQRLVLVKSLKDDGMIAFQVNEELWLDCVVEDISGFGDIDMGAIHYQYDLDRSRFRVKI